MRIAIIGSGISGLMSAYLLSNNHDIRLFEANDYLGGHTNTVDVELDGQTYAIDTGFIVFNPKNYPLFSKLLADLQVPIQKTEMSFSYRNDKANLEYCSRSINSLFSQRKNFLNPQFYKFISEILRFNKNAKAYLKNNSNRDITIQEFIQQHESSDFFVNAYLFPMISAIWSQEYEFTFNNSAHFILQFYENHGLLDAFKEPQWYVLRNGSKSYIPGLIEKFKDKIYVNTPIFEIIRNDGGVILKSKNQEFKFDAVVIATHSDQALKILSSPTEEEQKILSGIPYLNNEVILHTDRSVLPKLKRAWGSWNYLQVDSGLPTLTYHMNRLQSLKSPHDFCVSVNLNQSIDEHKIIKKIQYSHPSFNINSISLQAKHALINGKNNTYFAGAYWGYGFHEDGVMSAINACKPLGVHYE